MRVKPSLPNHFPKAPSPNTFTLGIRINIWILEDTNIQTTAAYKLPASFTGSQIGENFALEWIISRILYIFGLDDEIWDFLSWWYVGKISEKAMATHSSTLAWRILGMGEPGGLLSLGLHRVRHDMTEAT